MASQHSDPAGAATHYQLGLAALDQYLFYFEDAALPRAVDAFKLATTLAPDKAAHWAALGFALDASDLPVEALAALRRAHEIDPADEQVEVFVLTLLSELGPEPEAMAAVQDLAKRKQVDLESLRQELVAADTPVDARALLMAGFIRARNFMRSTLEDAIERSQRKYTAKQLAQQAQSEWQDCLATQQQLQENFAPDRVPAGFEDVTPWALRLGIGDDVYRSMLLERLTSDERSTLHSLAATHATAIHAWLDTFADQPLSAEAAAFMYLLLGVEETSTQSP